MEITEVSQLEDYVRELKYKIRGAVLAAAFDGKKEVQNLISAESNKLRQRTPKFENALKGVTLNTQDIVKGNNVKISVLGSNKDKTQVLRLFTGSKENERMTRKKGSRGVLANLNPLDGVLTQIEQKINNQLKRIIDNE